MNGSKEMHLKPNEFVFFTLGPLVFPFMFAPFLISHFGKGHFVRICVMIFLSQNNMAFVDSIEMYPCHKAECDLQKISKGPWARLLKCSIMYIH